MMLKPVRVLSISLATIVGIIIGYLLGGFVYEKAGDHVWQEPQNWLYWYQSLIGGVLALAGAAATVAMFWRQIKTQERLATARDDETYAAAVDELLIILRNLNSYWRAVSLAKDRAMSRGVAPPGLLTTMEVMDALPSAAAINAIEAVGRDLTPLRGARWRAIVSMMRMVRHQVDNFRQNHENLTANELTLIEICFSHLHEACRRCDSRLADVFSERRVHPVRWGDPSGTFNRFLDTWEKEHPIEDDEE